MSLKLTISDIKQAYAVLKGVARRHLNDGRLNETMDIIRHCVVLAQQFNWIYTDDEIELLLKQMGQKVLTKEYTYVKPNPNRVIFLDDFCVSFVLSVQYIDALIASGKEILYIATLPENYGEYNDILPLLKSKKQIRIKRIPFTRDNWLEKAPELYRIIIEFAPSQMLLHLYPDSLTIPVLYSLPSSIKTYLINLADQTFWLGAGVIDYCIEFRSFGATVSRERRGIRPEQQLMLPFYPVVDNNLFQGFPKECTEEGKVIIFAGSDIYKVLDEKRMFWHLVKRLLDTYSQVVFLFATKSDNMGMDFLRHFIKDNHYEGRFIYTKFRPDIDQVLAHTDIYMGTCPASGSLMSQLAARNAKPILQYYYPGTPDDETEQAICINESFQISFQDEEAFMHEADRLINDVNYRNAQGKRLQKAMIQPEQFNKALERLLSTNESPFPVETKYVDYKLLDDRWFALEKAGYLNTMSYLWGLLGKWNCFKYAPTLYFKKQIQTIKNILQI